MSDRSQRRDERGPAWGVAAGLLESGGILVLRVAALLQSPREVVLFLLQTFATAAQRDRAPPPCPYSAATGVGSARMMAVVATG